MKLVRCFCLVLFVALPGWAAAAVKVTASGSGLAERVAAAIRSVDLEPGASIHVTAKGGVITLAGWTATLDARDRAARAAEGVPGVTFSYPNIVARPTSGSSDVASKARAAASAAGGPGVAAEVSGSTVRLTGTASSAEQKAAAENAVRAIDGATRIVNDIRVEAVANTASSEPFVPIVREKLSPDDVSVQGTIIVIRGVTYHIAGRRPTAGGNRYLLLTD